MSCLDGVAKLPEYSTKINQNQFLITKYLILQHLQTMITLFTFKSLLSAYNKIEEVSCIYTLRVSLISQRSSTSLSSSGTTSIVLHPVQKTYLQLHSGFRNKTGEKQHSLDMVISLCYSFQQLTTNYSNFCWPKVVSGENKV